MPTLRSTERRLLKNPVTAEAYKTEMEKLLQAGAVQEANHQTSNQVGRIMVHPAPYGQSQWEESSGL